MMGSDLVARERIAQLLREAEAERVVAALVRRRRRTRRHLARTALHAIRKAVGGGPAALPRPAPERLGPVGVEPGKGA